MNEIALPNKTIHYPLSDEELKNELSALESGSFVSLTDDELHEKIRIIHSGFLLQAPIYPVGTLIYRAVRVSQRPTHASRVSYPPLELVKTNGRLNRPGEGMFYGSLNQFASCLQECSWKVGEFFAISAWLTTKMMTFNHLGYSAEVLAAFKSNRELPFFAKIKEQSDREKLIREWQARVLTQKTPPSEEHLYRLPIALKDFALGNMVQTDPNAPDVFSGVIYPSVAMWLLGDNIAILPSEVDAKIALLEVILLTLDSIKEEHKEDGSIHTGMNMKTYDFARADGNGNLVWGQKSQIVYPNGVDASQFTPKILLPE
jgi:hypothetical protein